MGIECLRNGCALVEGRWDDRRPLIVMVSALQLDGFREERQGSMREILLTTHDGPSRVPEATAKGPASNRNSESVMRTPRSVVRAEVSRQ